MKKLFIIILLWTTSLISAGVAIAGETGHYVCGVEGLRLGTAPPPGFYYKIYNVFYNTNTIKDDHGDQVHLRPDIQDYIMVHRPIWITKKKIFGANYYTTMLVPFAYVDFRVEKTGVSDKRWSYGDICFEFLGLAWHRKHHETLFSMALYTPTGKYSRYKPASIGKDFYTLLISYGETFFLDSSKEWTLSTMFRYEFHSKKRREDVRPGQNFSFEWSFGKSIARLWEIGLTGYANFQTTDDSGRDVTWSKHVHDRVFGVGPELSIYLPFLKFKGQLRHQVEFAAKDRSQGAITTISFTIMF